MADVLIIDDDCEMGEMLVDLVTTVGHQAKHVTTLQEGINVVKSGNFDVIFLDVRMPDGCGLDVIPTIIGVDFPPEIVVITGQGDRADAEIAITKGAWDYIQKPLSPKRIIEPLNRILTYRDGLRSVSKPDSTINRGKIIGSSPAVRQCLQTVTKAAQSLTNVLITGETGTGKELFARAVHDNSERAHGNFIVIDCAALPETLAESVLFGHEKGAFTGADRPTRGLVSLADGGTLFLDEVGEMSGNLQKVFLRVLQEKRFRPVGGKNEISSDFRLIAATNRDPQTIVQKLGFREDLLYRLNGIPLRLPPLRERIEDIDELATQYISQTCKLLSCHKKEISPEFLATLHNYDWPGNIRQLINVIEFTLSTALYEPVLFPKHLPDDIRVKAVTSSIQPAIVNGEYKPETAIANRNNVNPLPTFKEYRKTIMLEAERTYLKKLMKATNGNIKEACSLSGLGRTRLYTLLKEHDVSRMGWD